MFFSCRKFSQDSSAEKKKKEKSTSKRSWPYLDTLAVYKKHWLHTDNFYLNQQLEEGRKYLLALKTDEGQYELMLLRLVKKINVSLGSCVTSRYKVNVSFIDGLFQASQS
jgi:hypothetical protein